MEAEGPPNPISKAAASSNLPRQARARIGATTDPLPAGKELDAAPEHHFEVKPASHDVERSQPTNPAEMGLVERDSHMRDLAKSQGGGEDMMAANRAQNRKDLQQGAMDYRGAATSGNKMMDSRHRHNDFQSTGMGHSKHQDTVSRSVK